MNNPAGYHWHIPESLLTILKRLAGGGFLANNRQWTVSYGWSRGPWLFDVIRFMKNLKKLSLLKCNLTLTDVPQLLRSCPKLTELHLRLFDGQILEMNEDLKNLLRPGFQKLRLFELEWGIESYPIIQEMFT
jgi:hypothetical protein